MDVPANATSASFLVRGRIGDVPVERRVPTIEAAQTAARIAGEADEDSWASWMVLPPGPGAPPEPVLLFARLRAGTAGETRREVHALVVVPGLLLAPRLTAACGARLERADLEFVGPGVHMPCEHCLARIGAVSASAGTSPVALPAPPDRCPDALGLPARSGRGRPSRPGREPAEPPSARPERCPL